MNNTSLNTQVHPNTSTKQQIYIKLTVQLPVKPQDQATMLCKVTPDNDCIQTSIARFKLTLWVQTKFLLLKRPAEVRKTGGGASSKWTTLWGGHVSSFRSSLDKDVLQMF